MIVSFRLKKCGLFFFDGAPLFSHPSLWLIYFFRSTSSLFLPSSAILSSDFCPLFLGSCALSTRLGGNQCLSCSSAPFMRPFFSMFSFDSFSRSDLPSAGSALLGLCSFFLFLNCPTFTPQVTLSHTFAFGGCFGLFFSPIVFIHRTPSYPSS